MVMRDAGKIQTFSIYGRQAIARNHIHVSCSFRNTLDLVDGLGRFCRIGLDFERTYLGDNFVDLCRVRICRV